MELERPMRALEPRDIPPFPASLVPAALTAILAASARFGSEVDRAALATSRSEAVNGGDWDDELGAARYFDEDEREEEQEEEQTAEATAQNQCPRHQSLEHVRLQVRAAMRKVRMLLHRGLRAWHCCGVAWT